GGSQCSALRRRRLAASSRAPRRIVPAPRPIGSASSVPVRGRSSPSFEAEAASDSEPAPGSPPSASASTAAGVDPSASAAVSASSALVSVPSRFGPAPPESDSPPAASAPPPAPSASAPAPAPSVSAPAPAPRSEEHTSELQSRFDLVCRLLLEKKKTTTKLTFILHFPHYFSSSFSCFSPAPSAPDSSTLSLHDALPIFGACLGSVPVRSGSARIGFAAGGIGPTTGTVSISPSTSTVSISPSTSTVGIGVVVRFRSFVRGAADLDVVDLLGRGLGRDLTVGPGRHFVGRRPQRSVGDAHSREGRNVVVDALCLPFETRNMI